MTLDELVQRQRRNVATSAFHDEEEGSEKGGSGSDDESAAVKLSDWRMKTLLSAPKQVYTNHSHFVWDPSET